jgi:hypothetical protein
MQEPPVVRELWMYLLRRVNYKDNGKYPRGTAFFNLGEIQNALSWYQGWRKRYYSKPQLTKSLRKLNERNMIETQKATRGIYVSVLNYDYYQDPNNYESNDEGNVKETRKKQNGHTKNKKGKKEEEERRVEPPERYLTTARNYYSYLQSKFPNRKIQSDNGKAEKGAETLRKLEEIDGFNLEQDVKPALKWALEDDFWQDKVLSLAELRKKKPGNENHKFFNLYQRFMAENEKKEEDDEVAL